MEGGIGGWQAEPPEIADVFALAHGAARAMRVVVDGLQVDHAAITAHALAASHPTVGRDAVLAAAARFVDEALAIHAKAVVGRGDAG